MSPNDPNIQITNEKWKEQVKEHFQEFSLSSEKAHALEHLLLTAQKQENTKIFSILHKKLSLVYHRHKKNYLSHIVTALLAASTTFFLVQYFENTRHDFIGEMVSSLQNANAMPADFDLVGDFTALPQLSVDSLADQSFAPEIPQQLAQTYSAAEGRFFLFKGLQGVSINMEPHLLPKSSPQKSKSAVLYIVKLTKKNENSFPKQKVLKKIQASASKIKKIYAWREGSYGYAMVQPFNSNENTIADAILSNEE